jgi:hypothetical protein
MELPGRAHCSEVCAQIELEVDFDKVANLRKRICRC